MMHIFRNQRNNENPNSIGEKCGKEKRVAFKKIMNFNTVQKIVDLNRKSLRYAHKKMFSFENKNIIRLKSKFDNVTSISNI